MGTEMPPPEILDWIARRLRWERRLEELAAGPVELAASDQPERAAEPAERAERPLVHAGQG